VTCLFAVTSVSAVGLWLLGNPYGLLLACGIGVIDLLPIFGAGTVYVPWIAISLFQGKYMQSAVLGGMYVICYLLRNMIEARKMGDRLGFHPIVTLCAVYAGWKLFGLAGFLLGPIGLVIVAEFA
ncbi:MAG: AI-2E family transporter, partial [Lachnospiraceae bacterium]|nr:AI-2E family transporter [Lachnospiraceae bacterium]